MKKCRLIALCLFFLLAAAVFAQKIDTKLIYGSWETQNGTTKGFLTFDQKGAYYYAISDNTKGVDTMLEGTFTFEDDKGLTVLVMNQQKVHKKSGSTNEKATIKYTVVILTEKDLAMGRIGSSGFTEFTRAGYSAAPAKAVPAAVKTPGIPSAEFDLIMGCLENNAERVKYAIERGAYLDNQTTWFYVIPEHEAKIAYRSLIFWWYKLDKDYGINITYKDIDDNIDRFDIDAGFPIVWIPIINQNIEILSVLATSEKYKVFFNDLAEDIKNIPSTEKPKIESGLENGLFEAIRSEQFVRFLNDISK